eukprot:SAG11_NODE_575_length_8420_cov_2.398149_2_plen_97_part_00
MLHPNRPKHKQVNDFLLVPAAVVGSFGLRRLLLSSLVHMDEYHLCYNLQSLYWIGAMLERTNSSRCILPQLSRFYPTSYFTYHVAFAENFQSWLWC